MLHSASDFEVCTAAQQQQPQLHDCERNQCECFLKVCSQPSTSLPQHTALHPAGMSSHLRAEAVLISPLPAPNVFCFAFKTSHPGCSLRAVSMYEALWALILLEREEE